MMKGATKAWHGQSTNKTKKRILCTYPTWDFERRSGDSTVLFSVYNNAIKREVMSATSIDGLFALERLKNNNHSWGVPHLGVSPVVLKTRNREPPL
jgi:hypothetical protein